jgi:hypothetical protein
VPPRIARSAARPWGNPGAAATPTAEIGRLAPEGRAGPCPAMLHPMQREYRLGTAGAVAKLIRR